jgi:hypothetical protein
MQRVAIVAALSMLWLTSCSQATRFEVRTPDPLKDAACPASFPKLEGLKPLAAVTLNAPASALADDGAAMVLPAGTELVPLDQVLDREETAALAIVHGKGAWQGCRAVVDYRRGFDALMQKGK